MLVAGGDRPVDGTFAMTHLYLAVLVCGYAVQAVGGLRRRRPTVGWRHCWPAGVRGRRLAAHGGVVLAGLIVIVAISSVAFGVTTPGRWATRA